MRKVDLSNPDELAGGSRGSAPVQSRAREQVPNLEHLCSPDTQRGDPSHTQFPVRSPIQAHQLGAVSFPSLHDELHMPVPKTPATVMLLGHRFSSALLGRKTGPQDPNATHHSGTLWVSRNRRFSSNTWIQFPFQAGQFNPTLCTNSLYSWPGPNLIISPWWLCTFYIKLSCTVHC